MAEDKRSMLFFDVDGTLVTTDEKHALPESARLAIQEAQKNGHLVYINTGRVMTNIDAFLREVGFDGYVCGCGTYIVSEGNVLLHKKTDPARCREIAHKCRDCEMMTIFEQAEHNGYDPEVKDGEGAHILEYFRRMGSKILSDIDSPEFTFDKFTTWYDEGNPRLSEFKQFVSEDFTCIQREGNFIEVVPKGYSKGSGIRFLKDYYGIPMDRIYAFGDSNNDLDMLRYVKHSIAMGVCTEEVASVASYRTDTVENDGVYKAMKHFGLI